MVIRRWMTARRTYELNVSWSFAVGFTTDDGEASLFVGPFEFWTAR